MRTTLAIGLAGPNLDDIVRALIAHDVVPNSTPDRLNIDDEPAAASGWV